MLRWIIRRAAERERLNTLSEALDTRVRQLERERTDFAIEHAERMSQLDAMLRRMTARAHRAEGHGRFPDAAPVKRETPSVDEFRRTLRGAK